jgi:hypothetical protein
MKNFLSGVSFLITILNLIIPVVPEPWGKLVAAIAGILSFYFLSNGTKAVARKLKGGSQMKKVILLIVCLVFMSSMAFAQAPRNFKGLFIASPESKKLMQASFATSPLQTVFDNLPINLTGDTMYRINASSFDIAFGIDLASYKGLVTLRAEGSQSTEGLGQFAGAGLFLNIPTLLNMIPGVSWNASYINPSIGIVPGFDFNEHRYDTGIVLSIIQVTF